MELATNTFTKGLLSDTNPMITGNDVMTDCLNGTLITMNGNEIMLLNDMGNRRVNNAFLPSGYLPVGMKEYGGIIYIAAYNPITNKSLIGSFPSPLKKFDFEHTLGKEFNFGSFTDKNNIEDDNYLLIKVLKSDSFMISLTNDLTKDLNLRAGDKFTIYSSNLYDKNFPLETETYLTKDSEGNVISSKKDYYAKDLITNFYNAEDRKAKNKKAISPKNRKYTLSIGILNSQNEFVDITGSLCRWDEDEMISYDSSYSDVYKFNDGYFIAKSFSNGDLSETINDAKLIRTRQKIATNTYAYKLVGPMYLKTSLNHIENFDYNIYGVRNDDNTASLWIEGYLTYNCPDGVNTKSGGDLNYTSYQEGVPTFNGFDLIANHKVNDEDVYGVISYVEDSNIQKEKSKYDVNTNLYSVKVVKRYDNISANRENSSIFDFVLGVNASNLSVTENEQDIPIYLKGLSVKDYIDLSLLGSNEIQISGWKFYNNTESRSTTLTFTCKAYPAYGTSFLDLTLRFTNIENKSNIYTHVLPTVYNGRQTIEIPWGENNNNMLLEKSIYRVDISYKISGEDTFRNLNDIKEDPSKLGKKIVLMSTSGEITPETPSSSESSTEVSSRWLLTTELFNSFYNDINILDYCTVKESLESSDKQESVKRFLDAMLVTFGVNFELYLETPEESRHPEGNSSLIQLNNSKISYVYSNNLKLIYKDTNSNIIVNNPELYPVKIKSGGDSIEIKGGEISLMDENEEEFKSPEIQGNFSDAEIWSKTSTSIKSRNEIEFNATIYDKFKGNGSVVTDFLNIFMRLPILELSPRAESLYCGVAAGFDSEYDATGTDGHYLDFIHNHSEKHWVEPAGNDIPSYGIRIDGIREEKIHFFDFLDYSENIYYYFNKCTDGLLFTFLKVGWNLCSSSILSGTWQPKNRDILEDNENSSIGFLTNWYKPDPKGKKIIDLVQNDEIRCWWRTDDDGWALFYDTFSPNYKNYDPNSDDEIKDKEIFVMADHIHRNYVYCVYNEWPSELSTDNTKFYYANINNECSYNNEYSVLIVPTLTYLITETVVIETYLIGNLLFKFKNLLNLKQNLNKIKFSSSSSFLDDIRSDNSVISNIYYCKDDEDNEIVLLTDIEGKKLNRDNVYELTNDGFLRKSKYSDKFYIENTLSGYGNRNLMLYRSKAGKYNSPYYRYNLNGGDGDDKTCLDFTGAIIVDPEVYE